MLKNQKTAVKRVSTGDASVRIMRLTAKQGGTRRVKRFIETDKSKRVMSPLEAEYKSREIFGSTLRRRAMKEGRLRARRTIALAPAPKPVVVGTTAFSRMLSEVKKAVSAHIKRINLMFLLLIAVVGLIGIIAVHSGSMTDYAHRRIDFLQIAAFICGMTAVLSFPAIDLGDILKHWKIIYFVNVGILVFTLIFGYSPTGEENNSWINLGFTSIQPAEFSKILFILSLSAHLSRVRDKINTLSALAGVLLHGGSIIGLVLLERDWGNGLVFISIFAVLLFCAGINWRYIALCVAAVVVAFPLIWENLGEFRKRRVLIGFDPELDPLGYGHQVIRSRNAIASGGLYGHGYLSGLTIQRPGGLFAQHTDMVFAVIGQEFGFIGSALVIVIYALLIGKIISIAGRAGDYFGLYIGCGVAGMFIFQFVINLGMALGLTPVVGITLPLISYGASSLISMYTALALVMAVYANSRTYSYRNI